MHQYLFGKKSDRVLSFRGKMGEKKDCNVRGITHSVDQHCDVATSGAVGLVERIVPFATNQRLDNAQSITYEVLGGSKNTNDVTYISAMVSDSSHDVHPEQSHPNLIHEKFGSVCYKSTA